MAQWNWRNWNLCKMSPIHTYTAFHHHLSNCDPRRSVWLVAR